METLDERLEEAHHKLRHAVKGNRGYSLRMVDWRFTGSVVLRRDWRVTVHGLKEEQFNCRAFEGPNKTLEQVVDEAVEFCNKRFEKEAV